MSLLIKAMVGRPINHKLNKKPISQQSQMEP